MTLFLVGIRTRTMILDRTSLQSLVEVDYEILALGYYPSLSVLVDRPIQLPCSMTTMFVPLSFVDDDCCYLGGWRRLPALATFSWGTSSIKMRTASGGLLASLLITSVTPLLIRCFCSLLRVPATRIFTYGMIVPFARAFSGCNVF